LDIPAGSFRMGCDDVRETDCKSDTLPAREVTLRAFRINRREVTVAQYAHCADDEACTVEGLTSDPVQCTWNARRDNEQPLNCVSYEQAAAYCKWAGGALPTEAQWERVARGSDERRFPWGSEIPECSHAVLRDTQGPGCGRNKPWPGESRPRGVSPFGAQDMAGNLREWVADWFSPRPTNESEDPTGPKSGTQRVVRGGGWQSEGASLSAYRREAADPEMRSIDLGFRCARRVEAP
ncbi:MAG: formylglycine-generating enzyme family protein, partial [Myxococcales bacterium]|nr:formylglycine-generating enzyme family protein [Myxococcales bacterium]